MKTTIRKDVIQAYIEKFQMKHPEGMGRPERKGWVHGIGTAANQAEKEMILKGIAK